MKNPYRLPEQDILRNAYFDDISIEEAAKRMSLVIDPQMMESAVTRDERIKSLNRILYTGGRRRRTAIENRIDEARSDARRALRRPNLPYGGSLQEYEYFAKIKPTFILAETAANHAIKGINIEYNIDIVEKYIYINGGR